MAQQFATTGGQRVRWGSVMIWFCGCVLIGSSVVKFLRLSGVVAYMASMGYQGGTLFLVATLELISALLFLGRRTRMLGLLLVSSYLGAAIAGHLSIHRFLDRGGPFVEYMAAHRFIGSLVPTAFLVLAWAGTWLARPGLMERSVHKAGNPGERFESGAKMALGSNP